MELAVLMNNKAPGTALLGELVAKSNAGSSLAEIAEHLAARAEFTAQYPTFQTANEFATEWLGNALPEASAALLAECVTIVEAHINGGGSIPALVVSVQAFMTDPANADGGLKTHIDNFTNKVTVATYHTITKEGAAEWQIPATVTSDATTVVTANSNADVALAPAAAAAVTKNLTIASDIVTGGAGDDVFNATRAGALGTSNTYQANDQLDGGEGSDSLYIESAIDLNLATQKSLEKITVNAIGAEVEVTLPTDKAYTMLESSSSTHNVIFNNIRNGDVDAAITSQANTFTTRLNYFGTALSGAADNLDVTLSGADGDLDITGGTAANKLETLTLNTISDGTLDDIDLTNASTTKLIVTGSGSTTIGGITGAAGTLNTIDASAATGAVSVTGVNTTANTITGGAGNDTLAGAAGNDTISSGKGDDQITDAAGNDSITMGAGNDTFVIATATGVDKDDTVDGGEGTDTIQLTGTLDYSTAGAGTDDASGIKGFEVLKSGGTIAQDMTGLATTNTITAASVGAHTVTLTKDSAIADVTFTGDGTLKMATAGTQTVTLAGDSAGTAIPNDVQATLTSGATAINLVSAGSDAAADNALTVANAALTSITVTGAEDVDVSVTKSKVVASVDFSGSTAEEVQFAGLTTNTAAITYKTAVGTQTSALTTGKGADSITLGDKDDTVSNSGEGNDTITAGAGNDTITQTGKGADTINLGSGENSVGDSGAGNDTITGGAGNDTVTSAGADDDTITLGDGNDVVSDAGSGNDIVDGGAGNDNLSGGTGNDSLTGGAGNDTIADGAGNDTVTGGDGVDTLNITTGNDNVDAGAGNDIITITGLSGADTIDGGAGTDSITITNSSTGTLTPAFTNIESATIKTSSAFNLALTTATDKTSLKTYTITSTSAGADNIDLVDIASGSAVTVSDDLSWDGASTADTDDTGDIGSIGIDTTAGGTVTLNVKANEDAVAHVATVTGATTIGDASTVTINSSNSDTNKVQNDITSLALDTAETQTLTVTAGDNAGIDVGNISTNAGLETFTLTTGANTDSIIGTIAAAAGLQSIDWTVNGGSASKSSTLATGVVGNTTAAALTSINAQVNGTGSRMDLESIDSASSTALTSVVLKANGTNSVLALDTGQANNSIDLGSATVAAFTLDIAENASLIVDNGTTAITVTSGAITAATINMGNFSTFTDQGSDEDGSDLGFTGAMTTLNMSLGRGITNADASEEFTFAGTVTTLKLASTLNNETIALDTNNVLTYGGNTLADWAGITNASYTHTGTGSLNWVGTNAGFVTAGAQAISSNTASTSADTITGGAGNDTLTGNEGANTITGNAAIDTLKGNGGNDSLSGGAGNDSLNGGEGADSVSGGLGVDAVNISETNAAADIVQITIGANAGAGADNESGVVVGTAANTADDKGQTTVTGFDAGLDTIAITATAVTTFDHATAVRVSLPVAGAAGTATGVDAFVANTVFIGIDNDAIVNDLDDAVITFSDYKLNGVNVLGTTATDILLATDVAGVVSYNLTGSGAANTITTGAQADTITGAAGADTITGGAGADTFVIGGASDGNDSILDFSTTQGDKFSLGVYGSGGTANAVVGTAITTVADGVLKTQGATIAVGDNEYYVINQTPNEAAIDTVGELVTALADGGVLDAVDMAVGAGNVSTLFITGLDDATTTYVYKYTDDNNAAAYASGELALLGTITNDVSVLAAGTPFTTAQFI
jgi:Ca2+-binding RTX toxin-like protein